ncbi:hypothetical protein BBJ28_00016155 [Nothophytophthora sp. Chile5]|nr:hypothetical protein BBJ28_00016155 [Nothophytophthora sp. Chile5]
MRAHCHALCRAVLPRRDLKPDNILLSFSGHIKLTDFGLSEEAVALSDTDSEHGDEATEWDEHDEGVQSGASAMEESSAAAAHEHHPIGSLPVSASGKRKSAYHTYGRCGTPDYLAPEIILGEPHGSPVDYWALGVILYEMLVGFPPFNDDTVDAIFGNILERQILWPDGEKCLSSEAMDLIDKLLDPDPATRIGWEGMRTHPFFDGINWDTLLESVPPFVPTLEGPNDTSYFNNRNLTDIFIDDDEFDVASRSTNSSQNNLDSGPESDDLLQLSFEEKADHAGGRASVGTADVDKSWEATGALETVEAAVPGIEAQPNDVEDNNSHFRFPSGMYDRPDDANLSDAFRSFSFTNMNALAAASQAEADLMADTELQDVENSTGPSILI